MKLKLEINNRAKSPLKKSFLNKAIRATLKEAGFEFLENKNLTLSVALVGELEMRKLNKKYRDKNSVTDVLSFAEYEKTARIKQVKDDEIYLGELVLCYEDIRRFAEAEKKDLKKELMTVVAHGVLHLLGFRHGKKMFVVQDAVTESQ